LTNFLTAVLVSACFTAVVTRFSAWDTTASMVASVATSITGSHDSDAPKVADAHAIA